MPLQMQPAAVPAALVAVPVLLPAGGEAADADSEARALAACRLQKMWLMQVLSTEVCTEQNAEAVNRAWQDQAATEGAVRTFLEGVGGSICDEEAVKSHHPLHSMAMAGVHAPTRESRGYSHRTRETDSHRERP